MHTYRWLWTASLLLIHFFCASQALTLVDQPVVLKNGLTFSLKIPEGYRLSVAAEGLNRPRFFSKSPDGRLFVTDMYDRSDNKNGKVVLLDSWNNTQHRFDTVITYLDGLHNPNQVFFYSPGDTHYLYIAETGKLSYASYQPGSMQGPASFTTIARFPDYGLNYKYGGWHLTRSLSFYDNKIYISVGSSCDACIEKENEIRAAIIEMNADGSNPRIFARGLRNAVGMEWVNNQLWVTNMGRDNLGPDKPEDLFHTVKRNGFYGWPFYIQYRKNIFPDLNFKDSAQPAYVKQPPVAPWAFKAHSAPLGFTCLRGFTDPVFNNTFLVALHGSTSVWRERGNAVVQLLPDGGYRDVVAGFLQGKTEDKRFGRPCDIYQWDDHSFFISDDKNGVIYYVWKQSE